MKNIGILLPIFSLPNHYGIGDFGKSAYQFVDILNRCNLKYWEVLPINPIDSSNSPYSPISSSAIEPLFISLELLKDWNLLDEIQFLAIEDRINYEKVKIYKNKYLRIAYSNFTDKHELYNDYLSYLEKDNEYAKFIALKYSNNNVSWSKFENDYDINEYKYQVFLQFIAHFQWFKLKKYANDNNIEIIGDLPIYVNYESSDVYFNQKDFLLEGTDMKFVSGASPDYFCVDGQKWGHPLYNFENQKLTNYQYFLNKYLYTDSLFDVIRIDHFKAFDEYFKIPVDKHPKYGSWIKSGGEEILELIFKHVNYNKYIVEDLGDNLENLYEIRDKFNLAGMKIFQYSFDFTKKKDLCTNSKNMIVYPGNHDNNTILGWFKTLSEDNSNILLKFLENYEGTINEKIIKYLLNQPYRYLIFMIQDILGSDETSRINIPGINGNQWGYRLKSFEGIEDIINNLFSE